ncbi:hypothetical protein ACJX0J_018289, partial [Zea mays]
MFSSCLLIIFADQQLDSSLNKNVSVSLWHNYTHFNNRNLNNKAFQDLYETTIITMIYEIRINTFKYFKIVIILLFATKRNKMKHPIHPDTKGELMCQRYSVGEQV